MKIALDTNAYRALDDGNVDLYDHVQSAAQIGVPIIVLGELYFGIYLGNKQEKNLNNLNRFLKTPRVDILHIDAYTAKFFGEIATGMRRKGQGIQQNDIWIAALCKQHDYVLATADMDFDAVTGLEIMHF